MLMTCFKYRSGLVFKTVSERSLWVQARGLQLSSNPGIRQQSVQSKAQVPDLKYKMWYSFLAICPLTK